MFGEPNAILAGDALLTEAFRLLADPVANRGIEPAVTLKVIEIIARCAGSQGMVGGQVVDMESEGLVDLDLPTVQYIHTRKTGALIWASVRCGALLAGADELQLEALTRYGEAIGLAFQIADDVLDATATSAQLGKTAGRDAVLAKSTFVSLLGVDAAREEARRHAESAVAALAGAGLAQETLTALAGYIIHRSS